MRNILEEFAHGNIPIEARDFKRNSRYDRALKQVVANEMKLLEALDLNDHGTLTDYSEAQLELNSLTSTDRFVYGYRLGVLMTMEVFNGKDSLVIGGESPQNGG